MTLGKLNQTIRTFNYLIKPETMCSAPKCTTYYHCLSCLFLCQLGKEQHNNKTQTRRQTENSASSALQAVGKVAKWEHFRVGGVLTLGRKSLGLCRN